MKKFAINKNILQIDLFFYTVYCFDHGKQNAVLLFCEYIGSKFYQWLGQARYIRLVFVFVNFKLDNFHYILHVECVMAC